MEMVYVLEVDYGMGFEMESVWSTKDRAVESGDLVVKHSAAGVRFRVRAANVNK